MLQLRRGSTITVRRPKQQVSEGGKSWSVRYCSRSQRSIAKLTPFAPSLYLSLQFSLKAANYPLIPEDFERGHLPSRLQPYLHKLYGLTINPEQLHRIRTERRANSKYSSLENCRYEVAAAEKMMKREGIKWFDTTAKSIEELSVQLMQELNHER